MPGDTKARFKKKYLDDNRIDRLLYPDNPLSVETCYIQLALIKEKDLKEEQEKKLENTTDLDRHYQLREHERIENIQKKIKLKAIFTHCEKTPKRIYIQGAAGTGKSTLSRRLAYEWGKDSKFLAQYKWVFYIRLRDLMAKEYTADQDGLIEILAEQFLTDCSKQQQKTIKIELTKAVFETTNDVLWILDGYDELPIAIPDCSWWKGLMRSESHILITSRPGHQIAADFRVNLKLAVLEFSDDQIEQYVANFFNLEITSQINSAQQISFLAYIKNDLNLWSLAHTPIQLELLCSVWDKGLEQKENITLTSLYSLIVDELLKRPKTKNSKIVIFNLSLEDLEKEYEVNLCCLEQLAYWGMQAGEILFSKKHIQESYQSLKEKLSLVNKIDFIEKLTVLGIFKYYTHNGSGEFAHLTFQEYFAARHVVKIIQQSVAGNNTLYPAFKTFFEENKFNSQLQIVWWFVAGLLKDSVDIQALEHYFRLLLQQPRDIVVINELLLFIHCLEQSQLAKHNELGQLLLAHVNEQILQLIFLNKIDYSLHNQLISQLKPCSSFLNQFVHLQLLPHIKNDQPTSIQKSKANAIELLGKLGKIVVTKKILDVLIAALGDPKVDVRRHAAGVLGQFGEAATGKVITTLLIATLQEDPEAWVRSSAAEALGKLGKKTATSEVITALFAALKDPGYGVKRHAVYALIRLGKKTATSEIIYKLITTLQDPNKEVRSLAVDILSNFVKKTTTGAVIAALIAALKDPEYEVRNSVVDTLGKLREKIAIGEVITALIAGLQDPSGQKHVAFALVQLGKNIATSEVIKALLATLQNSDKNVKSIVVEVLGELGEKAATGEVITALIATLQAPDKYTRSTVADALGKLGEKAATDEVITALIATLQAPDKYTRRAAADALGKLGAFEVVTTLITSLKDSEYSVRSWAASALGKFGKKAATNEVITALTVALQDPGKYVRRAATDALGKLGALGVVPTLISLLNDPEYGVRRHAASVLGKLGKKIATLEVITALIGVLQNQDQNKYVRSSAVSALGKLYKKTAINEVIIALILVLQDSEDYVRSYVADTLEELSRVTWTTKTQVLSEFIKLFMMNAHIKGKNIQNNLKFFFQIANYCPLTISKNRLIFSFNREKPFVIPFIEKESQKIITLFQHYLGVTNFLLEDFQESKIISPSSNLLHSSQQGVFCMPDLKKMPVKKYLLSDLLEIKDKYGEPLTLPRLHLQHAVRLEFKNFLIDKLMPFLKENNLYNKERQKSIFISYAWAIEGSDTYEQDKIYEGYVEKIAKDLERIGCKVYLDRWLDRPGDVLTDFLGLMQKSDFLIPIGTYLYLKKYEKRAELENEREHVVRKEGQILSYIASYNSRWQKKIIPILLEGTTEATLPFLLHPQLTLVLDKKDYFDEFFALIRKIYDIDNRNKEFKKLAESFYQAIKALQVQTETDLKKYIPTLKRSGSPLHQELANNLSSIASSSVSSVAASSTTLYSEEESSLNFP